MSQTIKCQTIGVQMLLTGTNFSVWRTNDTAANFPAHSCLGSYPIKPSIITHSHALLNPKHRKKKKNHRLKEEMMGRWVYVVLVISLILSLRNPKRFDTQTITDDELTHPSLSIFLQRSHFNISQGHELRLEYDYYRDKCPDAEKIVRSKMAQLYSQDKQVPANLLRLFFHDCFIMVYHFNLLVTILGFL